MLGLYSVTFAASGSADLYLLAIDMRSQEAPSIEKCSLLSSGFTSGAAISFSRSLPITCSLSRRSRFLVNVVGCLSDDNLFDGRFASFICHPF